VVQFLLTRDELLVIIFTVLNFLELRAMI
jgi:hypothetical protein